MVGRGLLGRKAPAIPGRTSIIDEKISELKAAQKTHSGKGKPPGGTAIILPMWSPKRFAKWTENNDAVWSSEEIPWPGEDWWLRQGSEEQTENQTNQGSGASSLRQTRNGMNQRRNSDLAFEEIPISTLHQFANANTYDASRPKSLVVGSSRNTKDPKSGTKEPLMGEDDIDHIIDLTSTTRNTASFKSKMDINDIRQVAKSGGLPMQVIEGILQPDSPPTRDISPSPPPPPPPSQQTLSSYSADTSNAKVRKRGLQKKPQALPPPANQTTATNHLEQQKSPQKRDVKNHHQPKKETRFRDEIDPIVSSRTPRAAASNKTVFGSDFNDVNESRRSHGSHSPLLLLKSSSSSSNGASAYWFGALLEKEPDDQQQDDSTGSSNLSDESRADDHHRIPRDAPPTNNEATDVMKKRTAPPSLTCRREAAPPPRTRGESLFMEQNATKSPKRATTDRRTPLVSKMDERLLDREIIEVDRLLSALRPMVDRSIISSSNHQGHSCPRPEHYPLSPLGVRIDQKRTPPCRTDQREPEGDLGILVEQPPPPPQPEDKPSVEKEAAHKKVRASKQAANTNAAPETRPSSGTEKETMESRDAVNERTTSPNDSLLDADSEESDEKSSEDASPAGPAKSHIHVKTLSSGPSAERRDAVSEQAMHETNDDVRKSKSGPYCESECASAFQPSQVRTEEEASSFYTNARSDLAIHSYFAPPSEDQNNLSKDSVGVEVQLKNFNGPHNEDECSLFSSLQSVVIPEEAVTDRMMVKEGASLERKPSNDEYKSWNPYTMYGGACQSADNANESGSMAPMRRTHPSPHHDYWKSFSTIKTLGSFDSLSVIDEVDGVISDENGNLIHQASRDAIEKKREGDRRIEDSRNLLCRSSVSRYYPEMTQQPQLAPLPETPASSIWVNDCASQRTSTIQTASSVDNPSPLRQNLRAARGTAGFVWKRGVWQPQTDIDHIRDTRSSTTSPRQMPTSDEEIPRPLADSVLYLMSPLLSGDTEDVTALTDDDGRTTLKGDDEATDAAQNDCSFMCGGCTWNLNGIFC